MLPERILLTILRWFPKIDLTSGGATCYEVHASISNTTYIVNPSGSTHHCYGI